MSKIGVRFYSAFNLGDDLFLKIIAERYGASNITVSTRKIPFGLDNNIIKISRYRYLTYRVLEKIFKRSILVNWLSESCEALVYIGGSIFIENNNMSSWAREADYYEKINSPYYIIGSNFGPYSDDKFVDLARKIIEGAADVCFRDDSSYRLFKDISSVRVATDVAFSLDTSKFNTSAPTRRVVFSVIDAFRRFDNDTATVYESALVDLVQDQVKRGYGVTLMSFCKSEGDEAAIERVLKAIDKTTLKGVDTYFYRGNLDDAINIIAGSDMVVASRFHAVILGLLFGKKVLPIAYSDKTINILNDIGFEGPVVDIRRIHEFDIDEFKHARLIENDISNQIALADMQFLVLDDFMLERDQHVKA